MPRVGLLLVLGLCASLQAGCGGGGYAPVKGQVTLDGKPLEGATVSFYPEASRGAHGKTDADGRYELMYTNQQAGVPPGKCAVQITTAGENERERLPARYNVKSELTEEVKPGGNEFNFELKSK